MEMLRLSARLRELNRDEHQVIYTSKKGVKVTVTQTGRFSPDDYAVGLIIENEKEYK